MATNNHGKFWREFANWCQKRGLNPLPAHAWTLSAYIRWCESYHDYSVIVRITKAISRKHLIAGHSDPEVNPMVRRTLVMLEKRISNSHNRSALFDDTFIDEVENETEFFSPPPDKSNSTIEHKRVIKSMRSTPKLVRRRSRSN